MKLVVINDVGDLKNIHPANKEPVGVRLANLALKYDYGKNIPADFPRCKDVEVKNGTVKVEIAVTIQYGYNIPEVSGQLQNKIKSAIENMTGLSCEGVNVRFASVNMK